MSTVFESIEATLATWLLEQPVYFVGTAPLSAHGHVNISPKGLAGTFAVLGPREVAYLDYTGSGAETIAHLRENGRIVVMFCAFSGPPKIVRLHGQGRVVLATDPEFARLRSEFPKDVTCGQRSVIVVEVDRISDSCGYSVPNMTLVSDRDILDLANAKKGEEKLALYRAEKNALSIDGLPAIST
jgi:Pyridoxamine 5'-phosphate oxidase